MIWKQQNMYQTEQKYNSAVYYPHLIGAISAAVTISGHYNDLFKVWNFCNWVKALINYFLKSNLTIVHHNLMYHFSKQHCYAVPFP